MSPSPKTGDRRRKNGRVQDYVTPGWWQPVLTDEEKRILASGKIPPEWEPTPDEIERAERWAVNQLRRRAA